jgi:hypothetical protein
MTDPALPPAPDPSRRRYLTIQLVRLAGSLIAAAGALVWQTDALTPVPNPAMGKALFALGLFTTLVVPAVLRRAWRSQG